MNSKKYFENENIKKAFLPETNGSIEELHRTVIKYILNELKIKKKRLNLDISLKVFIFL